MMKKRIMMSSLLFLVAVVVKYLFAFSVGLVAADYGWPYSYFHFVSFGRQLVSPLLICGSILLMISVRDKIVLSKRYMDGSILFGGIVLLISLSNLFFSLHSLMSGSSILYEPLTQSVWVYGLVFVLLIATFVCNAMVLIKE